MMLAYIFWHVPFANVDRKDYEAALVAFQADLASAPPQGLTSCATFRISEVPWLNGRRGYEDWYFVRSFAALEALNDAAVNARRGHIHAAVASKMELGHGGLYRHFHGEEEPAAGGRIAWLKRPRGIQYEPALRAIADEATGFLSSWRRQMVLGPAEEFAVTGTSELALALPSGWEARIVERAALRAS
jgi:hypothetical protein